jgi:hypothetical protein
MPLRGQQQEVTGASMMQPDLVVTPPASVEAQFFRPRPLWPDFVGIACLLLAALGFFRCTFDVFDGRVESGVTQMPFPPLVWAPTGRIIGVLSMPSAGFLAAAAILTLTRNPAARVFYILYGVTAIPLGVLGLIWRFHWLSELCAIAYLRNSPWWPSRDVLAVGGASIVFITVVAVLCPSFFLVWFTFFNPLRWLQPRCGS